MKKRLILLLIFGVAVSIGNLQAQNKTDGKWLLKLWLFLEHQNDHSRAIPNSVAKDSLTFDWFNKGVELKIDTLKASSLLKEYLLLSVSANNGIIYKRSSALSYISIPGDCNRYVVCVNVRNGTSFRLEGFSGNDIIALMHEIMNGTVSNSKKKYSMGQVLMGLNADGLDFNCMYKGLTAGKGDITNYPCLRKCEHSVVTIH